MAIYIRFENGKQVETAEFENSPGDEWVKAPTTFSWDNRYSLSAKGKATVMTENAILTEELAELKPQKIAEIEEQADSFRSAIYPVSQPKNDEYRIKTEAARRLLDLELNKQEIAADNPDLKLLTPEAEVREITPLELAKIIVQKADETALAVGIIAAFETKGKKIVEAATAAETLIKDLETLITETKTQLKLT